MKRQLTHKSNTSELQLNTDGKKVQDFSQKKLLLIKMFPRFLHPRDVSNLSPHRQECNFSEILSISGQFKVYKKTTIVCNLGVFAESKLLLRFLKPLNSQKQHKGHDPSVFSASFAPVNTG